VRSRDDWLTLWSPFLALGLGWSILTVSAGSEVAGFIAGAMVGALCGVAVGSELAPKTPLLSLAGSCGLIGGVVLAASLGPLDVVPGWTMLVLIAMGLSTPAARAGWTRRRQHRVIADLERTMPTGAGEPGPLTPDRARQLDTVTLREVWRLTSVALEELRGMRSHAARRATLVLVATRQAVLDELSRRREAV
jgi:hypothetical protein